MRAAVLLPLAGKGAVLRYASASVIVLPWAAFDGAGPRECARAEYCDIRINLLSVSREHAEIVVDDENKVCDCSIRMRPSTSSPACCKCGPRPGVRLCLAGCRASSVSCARCLVGHGPAVPNECVGPRVARAHAHGVCAPF
jgi:hypothetical protein